MANYDFVIIGAGSAGCVLAERLTASGKHKVALIEAGGSDRKFWIRTPVGYAKTFSDPKLNWMYTTVPDAGLNNREIYWPRGKVLGGTSSINGLVFMRGAPEDFDHWKSLGNSEWGWNDVLPAFKRIETWAGTASDLRGTNGPMHVSDPTDDAHPLTHQFIEAAESLGLARTDDLNGKFREAAGIYQTTTKNGRRVSASNAFLDLAINRSNLHVIDEAHVTDIEFIGNRAICVNFVRGQTKRSVFANVEIILAAGTVGSPMILQRSGVGKQSLLDAHDIDAVENIDAVGDNLQDHLGFEYVFDSNIPTLNSTLGNLPGRLKAGMQYLLNRKGPMSLSVNQGGGFVSDPDIQLYLRPLTCTGGAPNTRNLLEPDSFAAFGLGASQTRPSSYGDIQIASRDPFAAPKISPNSFSAPEDMKTMIAAAKFLRRLASTAPLADVITQERLPGLAVQTDAEIEQDLRARCSTMFHPVGTCRMHEDAGLGVVNQRCEVHGVYSLRVVDASVFPSQISGNINATTMMIAERASQMILEDNEF